MPNLLKIVFQRSPKAIDTSPSCLPARDRNRRSRHTPIRRKENYLLPMHVIRAIREEEAGEKLAIPSNLANLVVVRRSVCESPNINKYHIGRALRQIEVEGLEEIERDRNFTVDVGEPGTSCGLALCVPTTEKDQCFWSQYYDRNGEIARGNDNVPVMRRFVCDRTPPFTNKLTLVIRYEDGVLYVIAAYYGEESKKFPGTNGSTVDDARWWFDPETKIGHALCATKAMLEANRFVKGTVTQVCPWSYDRK